MLDLLPDPDAVFPIHLLEVHLNVFVQGGGKNLPDDVWSHRELPMAAIHEHGEANRAGSPVVHQSVERGTKRAAGEEDVVDEIDDLPVDGVGAWCP